MTETEGNVWRNRMTRLVEEDPEQLLANPFNWRIHSYYQQQMMTATLDELGWIEPIVVNERTGHLVNGHMRVSLALSHSIARVPVVYVDLDETEEKMALATFDSIGSLAATDNDQLRDLLSQLPETDSLLDQYFATLTAGSAPLPAPFDIVPLDPVDVPDDTEDGGSRLVKVQVGRHMFYPAVAEQVRLLLEDHPEWGARIVG
jgi:hypothetical protein